MNGKEKELIREIERNEFDLIRISEIKKISSKINKLRIWALYWMMIYTEGIIKFIETLKVEGIFNFFKLNTPVEGANEEEMIFFTNNCKKS